MNARTTAICGAVALAAFALIFAYPAFAAGALPASSPATTATASSQSTSIVPTPAGLTVGQTITFTSTSGQWRVISSQNNPEVKSGTASGTVTLTVNGAYKGGYALSITSGSLNINGSTLAIASGSAEMGPWQAHLVGQGLLASATPGSFLMSAGAHSSFFGNQFNTMRFDVQANGIEYGVLLIVSATHS